jgi:nicotinate-nucleotide adenylyltransferase
VAPDPASPGPRRIGLLGGSFNPAHDGHRHISLAALRRLRLDEVWWLVSPQNPLKPVEGMAEFETRLEGARSVARHPRIRVCDIERRLGTHYTCDTLRALVKRFPQLAFVWLMGADNLIEIPRWRDWTAIFHLVPIAVFDRPTYADRALAGKAARRFARYRRDSRRSRTLAGSTPPAWVFVRGTTHPGSATSIRELKAGGGRKRKGKATQGDSHI